MDNCHQLDLKNHTNTISDKHIFNINLKLKISRDIIHQICQPLIQIMFTSNSGLTYNYLTQGQNCNISVKRLNSILRRFTMGQRQT